MPTYINRRGAEPQVTMAADGVVSVPGGYDRTVIFTKGSAIAATLPAPDNSHNGMRLTFVSTGAYTHAVTVAAGFCGGGGGADVATSAGALQDTLTVEAYGGNWFVVANSGYSFT